MKTSIDGQFACYSKKQLTALISAAKAEIKNRKETAASLEQAYIELHTHTYEGGNGCAYLEAEFDEEEQEDYGLLGKKAWCTHQATWLRR